MVIRAPVTRTSFQKLRVVLIFSDMQSLRGKRLSRVLAYFAPVLKVYFIRVGNALQKGINHQNYNDSVFVGRTSERALLLLQMQ